MILKSSLFISDLGCISTVLYRLPVKLSSMADKTLYIVCLT